MASLQAQHWQTCKLKAAGSNDKQAISERLLLTLQVASASERTAAEAVIATLYGVHNALHSLEHEQLIQAVIIADTISALEVSEQAFKCLTTAVASEKGLSDAAMNMLAGLSNWPEYLLKLVPVIVSHTSCCNLLLDDLAALLAADRNKFMQRLLVNVFGDLQAVWRDAKLKDMLLRLPCAAMQLLLSSNDLKVPSEDIVLFTAEEFVGHFDLKEVRAVIRLLLAGLVRAPHLSDAMLRYAALCENSDVLFMRQYVAQLKRLFLLRYTMCNRLNQLFLKELAKIPEIPNSWQLGQRQLVPAMPATLTWKVSAQHLKWECERLVTGKIRDSSLRSPETAPICGFTWGLELLWLQEEDSIRVEIQASLQCVEPNFYFVVNYRLICSLGDLCWTCHDRQFLRSDQVFHFRLLDFEPMPDGQWNEAAWAAKGLPLSGDVVPQFEVLSVT